jgi:hypothetical protein
VIFRRARKRALLEDRLGAFWRERTAADSEAPAARLGALLEELDVGWRAEADPTLGWRLETPAGRFLAGLGRQTKQATFLQFIEPWALRAPETTAVTLLDANLASNGAHYCLNDLDTGPHLTLRSLVGPPAIELGALALALESLLRQSEHTVGVDEPRPSGPSPTLERVSSIRRGLDPGPSGLDACATRVEQALTELELDWHAAPDRAHDWRIELDLAPLQLFLRPTGEALGVRIPAWEAREHEREELWQALLDASGRGGAWYSVSEHDETGQWVFATAVVSTQTLTAGALAYSLEEVLRHARDFIEA